MSRGVLFLTEGRSGSNWLTDLTNKTGLLGHCDEWLSKSLLGKPRPSDRASLVQSLVTKSRSENGFFSIKVFPAHAHYITLKYKFDVLTHFSRNFDCLLVRLTRRDVVAQAISFARSIQSGQWTVHHVKSREVEYDFDLICHCYFMIAQSNAFWDSYLQLHDLKYQHFVYEDMLDTPLPFLECVADHAQVEVRSVPTSRHKVQRDQVTSEWHERFRNDLETKNVVACSVAMGQPTRTFANFARMLSGNVLKPYPYIFN
ncbi:Stf0 family sulfotransferase [Thalassobius sp. I31.1]|uniref:Stf0 family sulfotransferase n=1 Tax=Thalassobius sp. I31.1 TaxID=2109912 RepID=UPI00256FF37F|nr:Stf0 family sulfotransferase [Thalassobius sp. I31.1]